MADLSLYSVSFNKADKATTLSGYGITNAYTKSEIDTKLNTKINISEKGVANGVATLNASGLIPSNQLPSYVDDALEYANFAGLPATGETGKIYVTLDTNKIYRWSGSAYIEISPTVGNADSATKLATARTITITGDANGSASFDGSANISITTSLYTTGVAGGTYKSVTVDAKGRVTAGSNPTTVAGYGITDTYTKTEVDTRISSFSSCPFVISTTAPTNTNLIWIDNNGVANVYNTTTSAWQSIKAVYA